MHPGNGPPDLNTSARSDGHPISFVDDSEQGVTAAQKRENATNIMKIMLRPSKAPQIRKKTSMKMVRLTTRRIFENSDEE